MRSRRQSTREAFVPLHHPPGHAQVDFGEAVVELRGQREKVAFFCLILPHSNVWFVKGLCCKPDVGVSQIRTTTVLSSCFCVGQTVL